MAFEMPDLSRVRGEIIKELELDIAQSRIYISRNMDPSRSDEWISLLRSELKEGSAETLTEKLASSGLLNQPTTATGRNGNQARRSVSSDAEERLAEGEFNRFYIRAVCRRAVESGRSTVRVVRGKEVDNPRSESEEMIGTNLSASELLEDLRSSVGKTPRILSLGPNSGITVKQGD